MRIAVTGASGFIGSHVLRDLAQRGVVEVIAVSRRSPEQPEAQGVRHVALDIAADAGDAFVALGRPDVLIHLAWQGLPHYRSLHHVQPHLFEQVHFLESMIRAGLKSLVCSGTCLEYGMRCGELAEEMPSDPGTPYALAKDTLRRHLEFLRREVGFDLTWARLFYMFGDGQAPTSLYPQLSAAARSGARSFAMSGGEQLRDYLPVAEAARLIVDLAMQARSSGIVNVCAGRPIAVRSLVEQWMTQHDWKIEIVRGALPYNDYEPMASWGSRRRLDAALGLA